MPNPQNIVAHRYKPGESGNRNGRPKKIPGLDELLASILCEVNGDMTAVEIILKALRAKAFRGDVRAAQVLLDRAYRKVKQPNDHGMQARPLERTVDKIRIINTVRHVYSDGTYKDETAEES